MSADIVVFGSLNIDLVVKTERAPQAGETLAGQDFYTIPGGKGANQAVAIARAGGRVAMVGRVGDDDFGRSLQANLKAHGVDTAHVAVTAETPTGIALIIVESSGENRIVLVAGANGKVSKEDVDAAQPLISQAKALVLQMEIPWEVTAYALNLASLCQVPTVLNLAPAYPIPEEMLRKVHYLIVNESEIQLLSNTAVEDMPSAERAVARLLHLGLKTVILTLGSRGALLGSNAGIEHFPSHAVDVVDTTAAGDAFTGSFVATLIRTGDLAESMRVANAAGALTVTKFGAQSSLPSRAELERFLASQHR